MEKQFYEVIVIGAGQAGLSASYFLKKAGIDHLVIERGVIGESWYSQRWDSFQLNSSNRLNALPGAIYRWDDPEGFCSGQEFVRSMCQYVTAYNLPVIEKSKAIAVEKINDGKYFKISVSTEGEARSYTCVKLIVASGVMNQKKIPEISTRVSSNINQMHSGDYKSPLQIPPGGILVVGSAQSGVQIAEDLAAKGRKVFLSTSAVARVPRRYRGKDCMDWLIALKFFEMKLDDLPDPAMAKMKAPHLTGKDGGDKTISLQSLAKKGVCILGRVSDIKDDTIFFEPNAAAHVKFADGFSNKVKGMIDEYIIKTGMTEPKAEIDIDDIADDDAACADSRTNLSLQENNICTIIWATGFGYDFNFLSSFHLNEEGLPEQKMGEGEVEGLYFVGYPWQTARRSGLLFGIALDAEFIVGKIISALKSRPEMEAQS